MPQLRVTSPTLSGAGFELGGKFFTFGREPDSNIHLDHTSVSKHHAMLKIDNGDFKLFDLHSTNGIVVNGERRVVAHLREGDKILLGETELCFEADRKEATQHLALSMVAKPGPKAPPAVTPAHATETKSLAASKAKDAPAAVTPAPGKLSKLSAIFRRRAQREDAPAPASPPSREAIHAGLTETFGKMGLEMPKPPPPPKAGPTEFKPIALPPSPKTNRPVPPATPNPRAQRTEELPSPTVEQPEGGTLRGLGVKPS
jgi:predicted component of type VI protein secretion system